ncbi:sterol desaturase family protein [Paraherbaspirillum soli]|uniref:Sterol desaturase family protein n=1 Tax=Paraherbaspirillum soli TaxID=631222 RepID=A0ABW0M8G1_9BURK
MARANESLPSQKYHSGTVNKLDGGRLKSLLPATLSVALISSIGFFVILFVLERIYPRIRFSGNRGKRLIHNFGLGFTYKLLFAPMVIGPLLLFIAHDMPYKWHRPEWYAGWFVIALDFILLDLTHFFQHILAHRIPLLWRFHAVHHIDEHLDVTTGIRSHFAEKFLALATKLPALYLLAVPPETLAVYEVVVFCFGVFHHSNIALPERLELWLGKVFVTPLYHIIHHGRTPDFTDSNYGAILSIWDALIGTRCAVTRKPPGFSNGLDDHGDFSLVALHVLPFTPVSVKQWSNDWRGKWQRRGGTKPSGMAARANGRPPG